MDGIGWNGLWVGWCTEQLTINILWWWLKSAMFPSKVHKQTTHRIDFGIIHMACERFSCNNHLGSSVKTWPFFSPLAFKRIINRLTDQYSVPAPVEYPIQNITFRLSQMLRWLSLVANNFPWKKNIYLIHAAYIILKLLPHILWIVYPKVLQYKNSIAA